MPGRPRGDVGHVSGIDPATGEWSPAFPGQRPPHTSESLKGNDLAVRHGAFAKLRIASRAGQIADEIRPLVPGYREADEPTIYLAAVALAQVEAGHLWLAEKGLVDEKGEPRGLLRYFGTMINSARLLCDRLALSPMSRAQLGLDVARTSQSVTLTGLAVEAELERRDEVQE